MQAAEVGATATAAREARASALALRQLLGSPQLFERAPEPARFAWRRGVGPVVPPTIGWLDEPPVAPPTDPLVTTVRDRATRLEFGAGDRSAARALLDDVLDGSNLGVVARAELALFAAWVAHRDGDAVARERWLDEAGVFGSSGAGSDGAGTPPPPGLRASALLLHATAGVFARRDLDALDAALRELADVEVDGLLLRLRELGVETASAVARVHARRDARRRLRVVAARHEAVEELLAGVARGASRALDDDVVTLVVEDAAGAVVRGVLWRRGELAAALAEAGTDLWAGELVWDAAADALVSTRANVVPALLGVQVEPPTAAAGSGPILPIATLTVLMAAFGGGLWTVLRATRRESEAARTRAEFVTTVTHELKTPLAGIRALAELLEGGLVERPERRRQHLARLSAECARLSMLIENVLDLGRRERGEHRLDLRPVVVREVLADVVELFGRLAERSEIAVTFAAETDDVARVDASALHQAVLNVLDNARKYAYAGCDRVGEQRIDVTLSRRVGGTGAPELVLTIRDYGVGVPVDERELVFERFRRGRAHRDGAVPGVGLGLQLARTIARQHGGDLVCEAPPPAADGRAGAGAQFTFTLPLAPAVPAAST